MRFTLGAVLTASFWWASSALGAPQSKANMDSQEILSIIDLVVTQKLKVSRAEEVFGPAEDTSPTQVQLEPRDDRFEYIILETFPTSPDIVVSVAIRILHPSPCDLKFFDKVFGKPRILPRLKPDQPDPYVHDLTYKGKRGQLMLEMREDRLVALKVDRFD
jgi:hypothetical protein